MKIKEKIIVMVVGIITGIVLSLTSSYAIASTLINSKDVTYEDNAGLGVTNVQAAIDGTCTKFSTQLTSLQTIILNKVYPVGSNIRVQVIQIQEHYLEEHGKHLEVEKH